MSSALIMAINYIIVLLKSIWKKTFEIFSYVFKYFSFKGILIAFIFETLKSICIKIYFNVFDPMSGQN